MDGRPVVVGEGDRGVGEGAEGSVGEDGWMTLEDEGILVFSSSLYILVFSN